MTNFEFFKDKLSEIAEAGDLIAIINGKPTNCRHDVLCIKCDRHDSCTVAGLIKWLLSEHSEETENCRICKNLKIDDKVLVKNYTGDIWCKRHFAKYDPEHDYVFAFDVGTTSWSVDNEDRVSHWKYVKLPEKETEHMQESEQKCNE